MENNNKWKLGSCICGILSIAIIIYLCILLYPIIAHGLSLYKNPELFSKHWSGVQSIFISVGVIFGGLWGAYEFARLMKGRHAEYDLKLLKMKIEKIEQEAKKGAKITVNIEPPHVTRRNEKYYMHFSVKVENTGYRDAYLKFKKKTPPVTVSSVKFYDPGYVSVQKILESHIQSRPQTFNNEMGLINVQEIITADEGVTSNAVEQIKTHASYVSSKIIYKQDSDKFEFFVQVDEPGPYLITFNVPAIEIDEKGRFIKKLIPKTNDPLYWIDLKYTVV